MEGQLSAETLKVHNAMLKDSPKTERQPSTQMGPPQKQPSLRERLVGAMTDDKKSDISSGSKLSTSLHNRNRFTRLKTKLKLHNLFGGTLSKSGSEVGARQVKRQENTFKTEPDDGTTFNIQKVEAIMRGVFEAYLKDRKYDSLKFPLLSKSLSDMIKERVKLSGLKRYKVVVNVLITQEQGQSLKFGSRCLWDPMYDNYATTVYQGDGFAAIGCVFAVYFE